MHGRPCLGWVFQWWDFSVPLIASTSATCSKTKTLLLGKAYRRLQIDTLGRKRALNCLPCSFGVPLGSFAFLRRAKARDWLYNSTTEEGGRFAARYSFIYQDYNETYMFWESVIMLRCDPTSSGAPRCTHMRRHGRARARAHTHTTRSHTAAWLISHNICLRTGAVGSYRPGYPATISCRILSSALHSKPAAIPCAYASCRLLSCLLRKLFVVGAVMATRDRPLIVQMQTLLGVVVLAMTAQMTCMPYRRARSGTSMNTLECLSLIVTSISIYICLFLLQVGGHRQCTTKWSGCFHPHHTPAFVASAELIRPCRCHAGPHSSQGWELPGMGLRDPAPACRCTLGHTDTPDAL